jgi:hypothetical protein
MDFVGGSFVNFFAAIGAVSMVFILLQRILDFAMVRAVIPRKVMPQLVLCSFIVVIFVIVFEASVNFPVWFLGIAAAFLGIPSLVSLEED